MTELLQELCELQIENEKVVRKASFLEFDDVIKVGALFYTAKRMTPDTEKIRACKEILKRKTGIFSNFRGFLMFAIQVKMSVSPDPEAYLDAVLAIYKKLAEGRILPGEILAMADSNQSVAEQADIVILAVKPQVLQKVIEEIAASASEDTLFISIAPGKSIEWITKLFGREVKIIRCMPNTPALVGAGMTGYCVSDKVTDEEKKTALSILDSIGRAQEVPEHLMAAVTSVSGSSPAYVYILIEAMADQAVADGMTRVQAYEFAAQAVMGSAKMVLDTSKHPAELKDMVCSPGGTTIEGVRELEAGEHASAHPDH